VAEQGITVEFCVFFKDSAKAAQRLVRLLLVVAVVALLLLP
jgi:hypothetical protein